LTGRDRRYFAFDGVRRRQRKELSSAKKASTNHTQGTEKAVDGIRDREYQEAFTQAYQTYYARVFAYIFNRVDSVEITRDLTAEIFEKAYLNGLELREPQAYRAWLFMIAKNTVAGYFRQQSKRRKGLERIKECLRLQGGEEAIDRLIDAEIRSRLMDHVRLLRSREQELLALKFDGELTNQEIARVMGMSVVNVRVALFRALSKLREQLKKAEAPEEVQTHVSRGQPPALSD